ncbi:mediator of RNA polymerase II transcription subunit 16 [Dorcoceras hygrometricum]|uniref:Mediator of RNA polymerase II transcription subunit 16 n=1 Tax=Dorcoceras hygrometricum TaxID=472368 RepID=A0A2Z7D783_9LAMI|nr:mediator of RNA polymerase II transcription subunit 16 [Dorcoceras hygrometricum]
MNNNNTNSKTNSTQSPQPSVAAAAKDSEEDFPTADCAENSACEDDHVVMEVAPDKDSVAGPLNSADDSMDEDFVNPATVFCIKLNQPKSNLLHKMSVPELCRTFR